MPPNGVYITVSHFRDRSYQGITNVGHKPTVGGEKFIGVETYLFDCNEDLYGEYCKGRFKKFLRPEQKFFFAGGTEGTAGEGCCEGAGIF